MCRPVHGPGTLPRPGCHSLTLTRLPVVRLLAPAAAAIRSRSFGSLTYASSLPPHRNGLTAPPQFPSAPLLLIASPPRPVRFRSSSLRLPLRSSASSVAFLAHAHRSLTSGGALIGPVRGRHDGHDLPPSRPRPVHVHLRHGEPVFQGTSPGARFPSGPRSRATSPSRSGKGFPPRLCRARLPLP